MKMDVADDNASGKEGTPFKIVCGDEEKAKAKEASISSTPRKLRKCLKININKPLIPLKIAIFCYFAGSLAIGSFVSLHLKHLGLTLSEISIIYMIVPFIQLLGTTLSGVVADKLGRSKPVLQANLLIALIAANSMLLIPGLKHNSCGQVSVKCHVQVTNSTPMAEHCDIQANGSHLTSCTFVCSGEQSFDINDDCFLNYISVCYPLSRDGVLHNLTIPEYILDNETATTCTQKIQVSNNSVNNTWCLNHFVRDCNLTCKQSTNSDTEVIKCDYDVGKPLLFILSLVFLTAYTVFLSNAFRIFDVTTMSMVKTYNSDFGRQRIWAIMGAMVTPPLAGYIISLVSPKGGPRRYDAAFYMFDALVLTTMLTVWKLDVKINPPAKDMLKKTKKLLKTIEILVFILTIFVIGTAWGFTRLYSSWYLEDLGATSTLMGFGVAIGSLSGLPFLFTSNWFVEKVGSSNLLLLALVGYVIKCTGYSFLINPWLALMYEILDIVTYHLLWVSVITHSHTIAPTGLTATVIATAGGVHFGVGKGSGSLIGGFIMSKYGGRVAYRVMAAICAGTAAMYALYLRSRRKHEKKEEDLKDTECGETSSVCSLQFKSDKDHPCGSYFILEKTSQTEHDVRLSGWKCISCCRRQRNV